MGSGGLPAAEPKQYGVTKPISIAGPACADAHRSSELEKVCFFFLIFIPLFGSFIFYFEDLGKKLFWNLVFYSFSL